MQLKHDIRGNTYRYTHQHCPPSERDSMLECHTYDERAWQAWVLARREFDRGPSFGRFGSNAQRGLGGRLGNLLSPSALECPILASHIVTRTTRLAINLKPLPRRPTLLSSACSMHSSSAFRAALVCLLLAFVGGEPEHTPSVARLGSQW
ncbi:hypothetical protein BD310DRAFT_925100 [Dichomitus squalens]|uniref:Uncharacterized protein n=1 Tax=Dichomitus squalens TaxID=114155 RepID=A0A4Q9PXU9_9APHY|nr:hypothetical protein BD310DRAFT_925100 [Dichomitus squalens]